MTTERTAATIVECVCLTPSRCGAAKKCLTGPHARSDRSYPERTMQDDLDRLREAWLDLVFQVSKELGIVALVQRLGWKLKPWAREREARDDR